jgi:hypothetical protein
MKNAQLVTNWLRLQICTNDQLNNLLHVRVCSHHLLAPACWQVPNLIIVHNLLYKVAFQLENLSSLEFYKMFNNKDYS